MYEDKMLKDSLLPDLNSFALSIYGILNVFPLC